MFLYTHYPQLPDLMNGVLRVVFGLETLTQFRFVALAFSFSALFFIYRLLVHYWGRPTAQMGLALWVVNPLWIQHSDYLHEAPYAAFFGFGSVYLLTRALSQNRRGFLVASGAFLFFTVFSSYGVWFFVPLLLAMATVAHYRTAASLAVVRTLAFLALFAVAAVLAKFATNAWALGGVAPWLRDLHFQYAERATDRITRTGYRFGIVPTAYGRIERFFTLLLFPIALFWAFLPLLRKKWKTDFFAKASQLPNPWLLFLAAVPFLWLFTEIWVGQYYPTLLVLPFYAVAAAALSYLLSASTATRRVGAVLFSALLLNSIYENSQFKKAFFELSAIRSMRAQLDSVAEPGQELLTNHVFDATYRYYFNRNIVATTLFPPRVADVGLESYADMRQHPEAASAAGAIFVQHKHLKDELYDKGYYYIFSRLRLWELWGNPGKHREFVDSMIVERDSVLMAHVARMGHKLYDAPTYAIWRIPPQPIVVGDVGR
jgi:hypothetical protein